MTNKLAFELQRLFLLPADHDAAPALIDPQGRARALVLELTRAPDWAVLGPVWQGVQAELDLPAPGIAVSGVDALQLWFSLAEPVSAEQVQAFLQGLCQRFLADVDARRVRCWPAADSEALSPAQRHVALVPAQQASGDWSAFVAPDLAPVFGDTPWLDIAPNDEGQANLLRVLKSIPPADFEAALAALGVRVASGSAPVDIAPAAHALPAVEPRPAPASGAADRAQARAFLLRVMQDEGVEMALRVEAAKALL